MLLATPGLSSALGPSYNEGRGTGRHPRGGGTPCSCCAAIPRCTPLTRVGARGRRPPPSPLPRPPVPRPEVPKDPSLPIHRGDGRGGGRARPGPGTAPRRREEATPAGARDLPRLPGGPHTPGGAPRLRSVGRSVGAGRRRRLPFKAPPPTETRVPLKARGGCAGRFMNGAT